MSLNEQVFWASQMNPGCLQFMTELSHISPHRLAFVLNVIALYPELRGSKAYMIWNDACDRDAQKAYEVFRAIGEFKLPIRIVFEHLAEGRCAPFKPEEYCEGGFIE